MRRLIQTIANDQPLMHLSGTTCTLNAAAASLLGGERIDFAVDETDERNGRIRVYVYNCPAPYGYDAKQPRGKSVRINSTKLVRALCHALQGYGTYRICLEDCVLDDGHRYYGVFFRNYDKANTL